jgi:hypothetical protein
MLCLALECEFKIRVYSLLVSPHGQAWAELELRFWFVWMRMLCLASKYELEFWVWSLLSSLQALARAGLVLKSFWVQSWIFEFCPKRSTLLRGVSAPRPLQGPLRFSSKSHFFDAFFTPRGSLTLTWGQHYAWTFSLKLACRVTWSSLTMTIVECFSLEYEDAVSCIRVWAQNLSL